MKSSLEHAIVKETSVKLQTRSIRTLYYEDLFNLPQAEKIRAAVYKRGSADESLVSILSGPHATVRKPRT